MLQQRRILCADDDSEVRAGVVDLLTGIGLDVLEAETGLEAIERARERRIDAALLDLHMPGCTGLEALPRLRELRSGLPCLVYSGDWTTELRERAHEIGAFQVLAKPIQPELLRSEILRALETWPDGFLGPVSFDGQAPLDDPTSNTPSSNTPIRRRDSRGV